MTTFLLVAEKPSLARAIADALCAGEYVTRKGNTPVHEFMGPPCLGTQAPRFRVTSVTGHMYSLDFEGTFNSWQVDSLLLFNAPTKKVCSGGIARHINRESVGCSALILFLDCDKEGENICFEVIDNVIGSLKKRCYRARFSSVTKSELLRSLASLVPPDLNMSKSVDARQKLDLVIGVAWTREQTKFFSEKYANLDSRLVSYGPCQTPTLGFCVERHDQINQFIAESFWKLDGSVNVNGAIVPLSWSRVRVFDEDIVKFFHSKLRSKTAARVTNVSRKEKVKQRPVGLNTVQLLKTMSKLGIGPASTMHIAEQLYMQGLISYPRTESTTFQDSFDFEAVFREHRGHSRWGEYVKSVERIGLEKPRHGTDAGDHPPITPCRCAEPRELNNGWAVYEVICKHFFATVSPDAKFNSHKVTWLVGDETFSSSTIQLLTPGYTLLLENEAIRDTTTSTSFSVGQEYPVTLQVVAGETSPPPHLTESDLISKMEHHRIGTDASIATHINNIFFVKRNYVFVSGSNRNLVPTKIGICLYRGYMLIDPQLVLPTMRAAVEEELELICSGQATYEQVTEHVLGVYKDKFEFFRANMNLMDTHFDATFERVEEAAHTTKPLSRCGVCKTFMRLVLNKRLYCAKCDVTYELPPRGAIKLYQHKTCPLDGFELVLWRGGVGQVKTISICPRCHNDPPFPGVAAPMTCTQCPENACVYSLVNNSVMQCQEECDGVMVFDPVSFPKWRLDCNICNYALYLPEGAKKIKVHSDELCMTCGVTLLTVDFNRKTTPLDNGATLLEKACVVCNQILNSRCKEGRTKINYGKRKNYKKGGQKKNRQNAKMSFDRF